MENFQIEKLNDSVTRILCPGNVYTFLIEGESEAVLVDTGTGLYSLKEVVDNITDKPYKVILTHGHVDHAGGAGEFNEVYLNKDDFKIIPEQVKKITRRAYLRMCGVKCNEDELIQGKLEGYIDLQDGAEFDLGGIHVYAYDMKGHTTGSMAIYIKEYKMMIFGDACNSYTLLKFDYSTDIKAYMNQIKEFKDKYYNIIDTVLYSHPHNFGDKTILDEAIDCCEEILNGLEGTKLEDGSILAYEINSDYSRVDGKAFNCEYKK